MNEEVIYPSMVIRSQAEAIELLEKENQQLKEQLEKIQNEPLTDRRSRIDSVVANIYSQDKSKTQRIEQLESVLKEIREKCKEPKKEMDYTIWVKLRHQIETLEDFEKDIDYKTHPALTSAYKSDIKNAIKDLCQIIKYKLVYKEDIKEIIDKGLEEDK